MNKRFLVAVDGSDHAWKALDVATDLAKLSGASLTILHVVPFEPMPDGLQEYAQMEGIAIEEMNARFHYSRALGEFVKRQPHLWLGWQACDVRRGP